MSSHLLTRLNNPHYYLNSLLSLPLPVLLSLHLINVAAEHGLERNTLLASIAAPSILAVPLISRGAGEMAESLFETVTWNMRVFNLVGLGLMRDNLRLGWKSVAAYAVAWFLVSFFFPQPPYLGPSNLTTLSSEEFDEIIAILPPSHTTSSMSSTSSPSSSSTPPTATTPSHEEIALAYETRRSASQTYFVVLCHAEWSRKSRELERTLSYLSNLYSPSPTSPISFHLLDPSLSPQTFYDLSLSTHPTSLDLPKVYLFQKGKIVAELPKGLREVARDTQATGMKKKRRRRKGRRSTAQGKEVDEDDETDASDEEREMERKVAMARYKWDRSAKSIIDAFKLDERSGISSKRKAASMAKADP